MSDLEIKARMRGGPYNGKVKAITNYSDRIEVGKPKPVNYATDSYSDSVFNPSYVRGHYTMLHEPLKDGSYYFIWMGWDE